MNFKENINILNPKGNNRFPERFENEIYYVEGLLGKFEPLNYISNFSLKYVFSGEENYIVNNKKKKISNGQYLAVNNHSEVCRINSRGTSFSVFLGSELLNECYRALTISNEYLLQHPQIENKYEVELFDDVIQGDLVFLDSLKSKIKINPNVVIPIDYYYEIGQQFLLNQCSIHKQINQLKREKFYTRKEIFKRVNIARNYLEDTICEKFDLSKLSSEAYLSKFQLIRDFKAAFGITPHRYHIIKKMNLSLRMIQSKKYATLKEIAFKLNYSSLASFSKQFKQIYGICPTEIKTVN